MRRWLLCFRWGPPCRPRRGSLSVVPTERMVLVHRISCLWACFKGTTSMLRWHDCCEHGRAGAATADRRESGPHGHKNTTFVKPLHSHATPDGSVGPVAAQHRHSQCQLSQETVSTGPLPDPSDHSIVVLCVPHASPEISWLANGRACGCAAPRVCLVLFPSLPLSLCCYCRCRCASMQACTQVPAATVGLRRGATVTLE